MRVVVGDGDTGRERAHDDRESGGFGECDESDHERDADEHHDLGVAAEPGGQPVKEEVTNPECEREYPATANCSGAGVAA